MMSFFILEIRESELRWRDEGCVELKKSDEIFRQRMS